MGEFPVNLKELEMLMAWGQFYSNSRTLAVPVNPQPLAYAKVQKKIDELKLRMYSINTFKR